MTLHNTFGIAARNFTSYPEMPDGKALVEYAVKMEEMGFDSIWVWDHILQGVEPSFPVFDSLTLLTAIAARTKKIKLSTGVLVLPLRNPVVLAKQLSSMDQLSDGRLLMAMASGWYRREFDAVGVPFEQRGKIMDENLDILKRFAKSWEKVRNFAKEAGKDPDTLMNGAQLPIIVGKSRAAVESQMMEWLGKGRGFAGLGGFAKEK